MKNWIMRMPEPIPFGLTFFVAITRAIVAASRSNRPGGGKVDTVFTFRIQRGSEPLAWLRGKSPALACRVPAAPRRRSGPALRPRELSSTGVNGQPSGSTQSRGTR